MNRKTFCNNFSKFLTNLYSENGKYLTNASVVDVLNFHILKVDTENENKIDQLKLIELFWESDKQSFGDSEYSKYNVINLIKTNQQDIMKKIKYTINLDSNNPNQIESLDSGAVSSDFFVGVSNNKYSKFYEKLKLITNLVSPYFKLTQIEFEVEDFELVSIKTDSYYPSNKLLSIILDNFDLNSDEEINEDTLFLNVV
jgi:hypothetical protein